MEHISLIVGYNFFYNKPPLSAIDYLRGVNKQLLLDYAISYCQNTNPRDVYYGFVNKDDLGTDFYNLIVQKVNESYSRGEKIGILNTRTSLCLLELILSNDWKDNEIVLSDIEIRERLLKAYLLLNDEEMANGGDVSDPNEPIENLIINTSLRFGLYKEDNFLYSCLAQIIKSVLFFRHAEQHLPKHLEVFLSEHNIQHWSKYIIYIYQIIKIASADWLEGNSNSLSGIIVESNDSEYKSKSTFIKKFCAPVDYEKDMDFTSIKSMPILFDEEEGRYNILFRPFFVDKIYTGLYFTFKDINNRLKGSDFYINTDRFRSEYGLNFSEKCLLNITMKDAFKGKYKHLGSDELIDNGLPDYYIRNGNKILLIENKDNLIAKSVMDKYDTKEFTAKLETCFRESINTTETIKPKAIKQLCSNINNILNGVWSKYDNNLKHKNCIIYPVIVVHHKEFSLPGINQLVNDWFRIELSSNLIGKNKIKNLTIINIDTLIVYQGLLSGHKYNIFTLIDEYWSEYINACNKKYPNVYEVINSMPESYKTFDQFISRKLSSNSIFTWQIKQYSKYFKK